MIKMIIDADKNIVGRLAAYVAKKALNGEEIHIINSEKAVITGRPDEIYAEYKRKKEMGAPKVGPIQPRTPERILKRNIRGMLPYKKPRGKDAYKNIKCYVGIPKEFEGEEPVKLPEEYTISKTRRTSYVTIESISNKLGAKV